MEDQEVAAAVIFDPINLRYATGARNMQVWTMHNACRYGFVATSGPTILFEVASAQHLAKGLETVDEIRPSLSADYLVAGPRVARRSPQVSTSSSRSARLSGKWW